MNAAPETLRPGLRAHFDRLPAEWRTLLAAPLAGAALARLCEFLEARLAAGARIFPPQPLVALQTGGPATVRVVILGQDPYHGAGQAHGYAFSVPAGVRIPPSLRNIHQELARAAAAEGRPAGVPPPSGSLLHWVRQGVLLLNTVLTVEEGAPASHAGRGWEDFTDAVIEVLARAPGPRVFLLWGAQAQAKAARIAAARATVVEAAADAAVDGAPLDAVAAACVAPLVLLANHPSPLSARRPPRPFIGCGHFTQANDYLRTHGLAPIAWEAQPAP